MLGWPVVWGQATESSPGSLAALALRRWCASLTLCSPEAVPGPFGLWSWLLGLLALLILAAAVQGPIRSAVQLFDLAGHARLVSVAVDRLRRAGRMVALTVGATVLAWTVGQTLRFNDPQGRDDLLLLTRSRSLAELALEQGTLAALTPCRDLFALGDNLPLLALAIAVLFRAMTERADRVRPLAHPTKAKAKAGAAGGAGRVATGSGASPAWGHLGWAASGLYLLYRMSSRFAGTGDLPLGGCLIVEAAAVPALMAIADGVLLAWVLVELRGVSLSDTDNDAIEPSAVVALLPGAVLTCLLALPGRYLATAVLLGSYYLPAVGSLLRWLLGGHGLVGLQGAALPAFGLAGALAWSRGTPRGALRAYRRLLAAEGGRLVAVLALAGLAAGVGSAAAYLAVLSLPASPWLLSAADGYAHYATLPVGLLTLAALVELGERSLPTAALAPPVAAPGADTEAHAGADPDADADADASLAPAAAGRGGPAAPLGDAGPAAPAEPLA